MKAKRVDGNTTVLVNGIARIQAGTKGLTVHHMSTGGKPPLSLNDCLDLIDYNTQPFEICTVIFEHARNGGMVYQCGNYAVGQWYFHGKTTGLY